VLQIMISCFYGKQCMPQRKSVTISELPTISCLF
jgi:hypothetical protein